MCDSCDWEDTLEWIDEILGMERAQFAQDTLESIRDWIEENEHCTEGQKTAIGNIEAAATR